MQVLGQVHISSSGVFKGRLKFLRKHFLVTWGEFQQSLSDDAVDQWRKRLEACIHADPLRGRCPPKDFLGPKCRLKRRL